ncbi:calcium-binding protein [Limnohabitans sp.]|uniref:calcium-binding protein n=1 Tax=Limnohabitans sp. TaxID=1907725 RepID=UPI0039BC31FC
MAVLNALYRNGAFTCIDTRMADASGNGQGVWSQKPGVSRFDLIDTIFDSAYITENTLHLIIKSTNAPTTKKQVIFHGVFAGAEGALTSNQFKNTALTGFIKTVYEGDMNDPHSMREVLSGINLPFNNFIDATWETLFNGNDKLTGGSNDDYIYSYGGNDLLKGGGGNDLLDGGSGNDTLDGGAGNDRLIGGGGTDTASYASAAAAVTVSLALTTAQNTVGAGTDTLNTIENLTGSSFNDTLKGSSSANTLHGGTGADVVWGGAGNDMLYGGSGTDQFVFDTTLNAYNNLDTIKDFVQGTDKIVLDDDIFKAFAGKNGVSSSQLKVVHSVSDLSGNSYLTYVTANDTLYYDSNGSGTGDIAFVKIELLGTVAPTYSDFQVIA